MKKKTTEPVLNLRQERGLLGDHLNFAAAEAYKLLRTNLLFALPDEGHCRVLGVTSALRGEGKSTTTINLAYSLAEAGKRVLLVETDLRLPTVSKRLALRVAPGLSNLLAGLAKIKDVIQDSGMQDTLKVIVAGDIPPNPQELIGSERMKQVLEELKQDFDFLLFDLPPVNAVADGLVISRLMQGMLLVVRRDYGDRRAVADAVRQLQYLDAKILGFVMTHNYVEKSASYGRYGRYGKHGRYGGYGNYEVYGYDEYAYQQMEAAQARAAQSQAAPHSDSKAKKGRRGAK